MHTTPAREREAFVQRSMTGSLSNVLRLASALAALSFGQDIDTVLLRENAGPKRFTIIDQIADVKERRAFLELYGAREPRKRRKLAEDFVASYPQSWMLAQAYEIASKACMDLDDYDAAVQFGAQSLRLFPENPLLLVPLANVQAKAQQLAAAEERARAALEYLDRFDRPASISASDWPAMQSELKATAYFVLGRAALAQALQAPGSAKQQRLLQAESSLVQARALNSGDAEIVFLLGLTELSLGKQRTAALYFARARRTPGPLAAKALENLERIYQSYRLESPASFEAFVTSVEHEGELHAPAESPSVPAQTRPASYAGSQSCRPCHAAVYESWQKTGMGRMLRPYRAENVIGDFRAKNQFSDETGAVVARAWIEHDKHYFAARDKSGNWRTYPIDYTIGSKWQQAYASRLPTGEIHVFPVQYNAITKQWVNYWKLIDPPGSARAEISGFNRLSSATSYQINCAPCHTSQLRLARAGSQSGNNLEFREPGINCEMCHGPAQAHVLAMTSHDRSDQLDAATPVDFRRISAREYVAVCAQCHAQSALRQPGPHGEMNYPPQHASFPPTYLSQPYSDASRRAFYKDGRFRETTFIAEAFSRTACFRKGQAHCGHCHQPHAPDASSNPTSLKFRDDPDRMCLQCHSKFGANISAHTHHAVSSEGSRCVACHMPRIVNSLLFQARTHQIDDIPNAAMTARFGREESPHACLVCHVEKDARWIETRFETW
jgi:predicted CXXCH cytochrome family protein